MTLQAAAPRILIIRLSAIGDVLVTTPVARALRMQYPQAHLAWVVEPKARDILQGNPFLDEILVWKRTRGIRGWSDLPRLTRRLRGKTFDWAIDCQGLIRSALVARISGARQIIGNDSVRENAERLYTIRIPRRDDDPSSRQRCLDLLKPLGIESSDRRMVLHLNEPEMADAQQILEQEGLPAGSRYACLVAATTWPQKHWFEEHWAQLARRLWDELGMRPVIMGSGVDLPSAHRIKAASGVPCLISAGKTSLKVAAAVLKGAEVTVAVDTALMHASVAVGTPTLALCGASNWRGFQDYEPFEILREPMPCSPCVHHPTCNGRFDCMRALTPAYVISRVQPVMRRRMLQVEPALHTGSSRSAAPHGIPGAAGAEPRRGLA